VVHVINHEGSDLVGDPSGMCDWWINDVGAHPVSAQISAIPIRCGVWMVRCVRNPGQRACELLD
jgi:hypothetical protein